MKKCKPVFLLIGILVHLNSYSQNDTIIKNGYVNIATLMVDFDTYAFEGGNMSYYVCPNCAVDSIPFLIDYNDPLDFGGITFYLSPVYDTVFNASIIWMGNSLK